jgi:hypothetical protein
MTMPRKGDSVPHRTTARQLVLGTGLSAALLAAGCTAPDPKAELEIAEAETYWAIESSVGSTHYIAPVVRLLVRAKGREPLRSVQATAVFRQKGDENQTWGTAWFQVASHNKPISPQGATLVLLQSDGRYHSADSIEQMLQHAQFKDATAEVFFRVGSSGWVSFLKTDVERRIGSRTVAPDAR